MDEARIYIDFNERVDGNVFLLSKDDSKVDSKGNTVTFYEDMPLRIWSDDQMINYLFAMKTMHAEVVRVDETTSVIRINNAVVPNFL